METNTLHVYHSVYAEMRMRLKSILAVVSKTSTASAMIDHDCYILQMTPSIKSDENRLTSEGRLFDYNLYIGTIFSGKSEESRIFRRHPKTNKLVGYVSYRSCIRKSDAPSNNNLCPIRDMWFIVERWPVISIRDIDSAFRDPTVYIRTDIQPIRVL